MLTDTSYLVGRAMAHCHLPCPQTHSLHSPAIPPSWGPGGRPDERTQTGPLAFSFVSWSSAISPATFCTSQVSQIQAWKDKNSTSQCLCGCGQSHLTLHWGVGVVKITWPYIEEDWGHSLKFSKLIMQILKIVIEWDVQESFSYHIKKSFYL